MTWTQHISYESLEKINLSLRSLELVICQRITSKNTRPRWVDTWARGTVMWYWSADTLFWQLSIDHNIDVQLGFSWAPKLQARKCENKHWFPCGADGRSFVRCTVTWLPNFLGWVDFLIYGAAHTRRALHRAWSSPLMFVDSQDVQKVRGLWNEIDSQASTCLFMRNLIYFVTCDFWTNRKV